MRILVAGGAGHLREVVKRSSFDLCACGSSRLVTFLTSNGEMRSGQDKTRLLVPRQAECRGLVAVESVTLLAAVQVRCSCKLRLVLVLVAVEAAVKLNFVERLFSVRNVALRALKRRMFALQRIRRGLVLFQSEFCRLESIHRMTTSTLGASCASCKLPLVIILMAIHALLKGKRLFEICLAVAGNALHLLVLS